MKKLIAYSIWVIVIIFSSLSAIASGKSDLNRICTRSRGASVNLRTEPGSNYPPGLVQVGSGGSAVNNYFRQRRYQVPNGEEVYTFSKSRGTDGHTWYLVGNNQWNAWVRSNYVCHSRNSNE